MTADNPNQENTKYWTGIFLASTLLFSRCDLNDVRRLEGKLLDMTANIRTATNAIEEVNLGVYSGR